MAKNNQSIFWKIPVTACPSSRPSHRERLTVIEGGWRGGKELCFRGSLYSRTEKAG
jgi:hypothetical protein